MHIVTSYFIVRHLPGAMQLGSHFSALRPAGRAERDGGWEPPRAFGPYSSAQQQRQEEYLECLWRNTRQPDVEAVHVIVEGMDAYQHFSANVLGRTSTPIPSAISDAPWRRWTSAQRRKIIPFLRLAPGPPTYADLFGYANVLLPGKLVMVANADVYLAETLLCGGTTSTSQTATLDQHDGDTNTNPSEAMSSPQKERKSEATRRMTPVRAMADLVLRRPATEVGGRKGREGGSCDISVALALTRYEVEPEPPSSPEVGHLHLPLVAPLIAEYRGSHDAFVLQPPVPESFLRAVQHRQNCYQAENIVVYELERSGFTVLNPCLSIPLVHRHEADLRQWFPSVDPSRYGRAVPMTLTEALQKVNRTSSVEHTGLDM